MTRGLGRRANESSQRIPEERWTGLPLCRREMNNLLLFRRQGEPSGRRRLHHHRPRGPSLLSGFRRLPPSLTSANRLNFEVPVPCPLLS